MRGKLMLAAGAAAGYVLGSRAGRGRYEQISQAAAKLWGSEQVQTQVKKVEGAVKDKTPQVVGFVASKVKGTVSKKKSSPSGVGRGN